jgi:hypothetical protein
MATQMTKYSDSDECRVDTGAEKVSHEELLAKLTNEPDFATDFLANFTEIQKTVAAFKKANREQVSAAKAKAKSEKETHERSKLMEQIDALREVEHSDNLFPDNCVEGLSILDIKDFIKTAKGIIKERKTDAIATIKAEKDAAKAEKEAAKMAKQLAKEQKEAEKAAKKAEKKAKLAAKDRAKREKLLTQLGKLVEKDELDFVPEYNDETTTDVLAEHVSRCKCAIALAKMRDTVKGLPESNAEEADIEGLELITKRAKLLATLIKMDIELDYTCEHNTEKLKELVAETKKTLANGDTP